MFRGPGDRELFCGGVELSRRCVFDGR